MMGGLAIQVPSNLPESKKFLPSNRDETFFVTCDGIRLLVKSDASRGDLPNLSKAEITSKSKANGIAKGIVCIQALWFIAQCISRRKS